MKFYLSALIALGVFCVAGALAIDGATSLLGRPSRGVSYGIGIYYLNIIMALIGAVALLSIQWVGRRWPFVLGAIALYADVFVFLGQPSWIAKFLVAFVLSAILGAAIALLAKVNTLP